MRNKAFSFIHSSSALANCYESGIKFFVVLTGKNYAVSQEYDAADEDIYQIFAILKKSKEIIQRYV